MRSMQTICQITAVFTALGVALIWIGCESSKPKTVGKELVPRRQSAPSEGPRIEGYGNFVIGGAGSALPIVLDSFQYTEDEFAPGVGVYQVSDHFVTEQRVTPVDLRLFVRNELIEGIELRFHFTRQATPLLFGGVRFSPWSPDISLISNVRQMLIAKYEEMSVTHDHFALGEDSQRPEVKLVVRDEASNALSLTWVQSETDGYLYLRYATDGFFREFWNVGEVQRQVDKL